jgi:hypothetical protein
LNKKRKENEAKCFVKRRQYDEANEKGKLQKKIEKLPGLVGKMQYS